MWRKYHQIGGIEYGQFKSYYSGADIAVGIVLSTVRSLACPIDLNRLREQWVSFHPPQQFAYLDEDREREVKSLKCSLFVPR